MCDYLELQQLLDQNRRLEHENRHLRGVVQKAVCGDVLNRNTSCQQARAHDGLHAWSSPDGEVVVKWG